MNKKVLELLRKGMSHADIAMEVEGEAIEIAKAIESAQKALDLEKLEAEKQASKEFESKVEKGIEKVLEGMKTDGTFKKSINIQSKNQFSQEYKTVNRATGKIEAINHSESNKAFNNLFYALKDSDVASAKAISAEIEQNNAIRRKAANDPARSDSAPAGGYAIPDDNNDMIIQAIYAKSVMLGLMNTSNIISENKIYPIMYGMSIADIADQNTDVTETQATFGNPTVAMERAGAYSNIANTIIAQRADITGAFQDAYSSNFAEFLDLRFAVGNVTNTGDLVDGIVFDTNTNAPTAFALSALTISKMKDIKNALSNKASGNLAWVCNRKVADTIGLLENGAGNLLFPGYVNGGKIAPLGIPLVTNSTITSALDVGGDARTGGSDDVLILADFSKCIAGIGDVRIDFSPHWRFSSDETTIRGVQRYGSKVLGGSGDLGILAVAQELTN